MQPDRLPLEQFESLILVCGMAGAGKTTTMGLLRDSGYSTVDNLPFSFLREFLKSNASSRTRYKRSALLIDIDSSDSCVEFMRFLSEISPFPKNVVLLFLDSATQTIVKRYSETRRPHPIFDPAIDTSLSEGIERERVLLYPIKAKASFIVDSSEMNSHLLRQELKRFVEQIPNTPAGTLRVNFLSFGFKHGAPLDCDLIVDVRFMRNPHFVENLRPKDGTDPGVALFVLDTDEAKEFLEHYLRFLHFVLPLYAREGKAYLNVGVGCTGGQHRSVAIAERLAQSIQFSAAVISVRHRDLPTTAVLGLQK